MNPGCDSFHVREALILISTNCLSQGPASVLLNTATCCWVVWKSTALAVQV